MKRCIKTHTVASFGTIPEGSLWEDDSEYVTDESCFVDADAPVTVEPVEPRPVKKSAAKPAVVKES